MNSVGADIRVRGLVQGVGFRHFCWRRATQLGVFGWVKNAPDGSVVLRVEGDRGAVEALIDELKTGPSSASVSDVAVNWVDFTGACTSFQITR